MRPLLWILIIVLFVALYIFLVIADIIEPLTFGENGKGIISAGVNASKGAISQIIKV